MSATVTGHGQPYFQGDHNKVVHKSVLAGAGGTASFGVPFDTILNVLVTAGASSPVMNTVYATWSGKTVSLAGLTNGKTYTVTVFGY